LPYFNQDCARKNVQETHPPLLKVCGQKSSHSCENLTCQYSGDSTNVDTIFDKEGKTSKARKAYSSTKFSVSVFASKEKLNREIQQPNRFEKTLD
jgi:hypothetical protein